MAVGLPEPERLSAAFSAAIVTLANRGVLVPPSIVPAQPELTPEQAARDLARLSRHIRYSDEDWVQILGAEGNIEHAYAAAMARGLSGSDAAVAQRARELLLSEITR